LFRRWHAYWQENEMEKPRAGDSGQSPGGQAWPPPAGLPGAASLPPGAGPLGEAASAEGMPADPVRQPSVQPGGPHGGLSRRRLLLSVAATVGSAALAAAVRELTQGGSGLPTLWSFAPASGGVYSTPVVQGGAVYFGTVGGDVYALRASNGSVLWHHNMPSHTVPSVVGAVAGGAVYILVGGGGGPSDKVAALRARDGGTIWESGPIASPGLPPFGPAPVAVAGGIVCVAGSDSSTVYGLRAGDGSTAWHRSLGYLVGPATANGVVYIGSFPAGNRGYVAALRASDGATIWRSANVGSIAPPLTVVGNVVYASDGDRRLYAFRASDGATIWGKPLVGLVTAISVAGGAVYAMGTTGGNVNYLYALRARDGATAWRKPIPLDKNTYITLAAAAYGVVYVGSSFPGVLYAFRASDGALLWRQSALVYGVAAANHVVYAGGGYLYALRG
jgi:outer membrane protein assembly factor BamB